MPPQRLRLSRLVVLPSLQGLGIGSRVCDAACLDAACSGDAACLDAVCSGSGAGWPATVSCVTASPALGAQHERSRMWVNRGPGAKGMHLSKAEGNKANSSKVDRMVYSHALQPDVVNEEVCAPLHSPGDAHVLFFRTDAILSPRLCEQYARRAARKRRAAAGAAAAEVEEEGEDGGCGGGMEADEGGGGGEAEGAENEGGGCASGNGWLGTAATAQADDAGAAGGAVGAVGSGRASSAAAATGSARSVVEPGAFAFVRQSQLPAAWTQRLPTAGEGGDGAGRETGKRRREKMA